jgi:branched-chain amino acid transport system substrate-binding protein
MTGLSFPTPSGMLTIREDHNGIEDCLVGITKLTPKYPFPILDKTEVFPAAQVNPPVGTKTVDWINSWK